MSRHQNTGQNHNVIITYTSFENVSNSSNILQRQ